MRYIQEVDNPENLRALVTQDLKELGIRAPKVKKTKSKDAVATTATNSVFGNYLNMVPCLMVQECGPVPQFLVEATSILDKHIDVEGLFRKSGSVARQKEQKIKVEEGLPIQDANPLDMASLIKQFFRELPDPLFTTRLHDTFLKSYALECEDARTTALLLLCHLLPWHHLSTLRFFMLFLQKVADNCDLNKMDVTNLAVCLTPNLMQCSSTKADKMNCESRVLQNQTNIVHLLILRAGDIGMVPDSLIERALLMSTCFPSEDEIDKSESLASEGEGGKKKKKRRSGSLQGMISNLSSSFTKWRKDKDGKGHNSSNLSVKSSMSYLSFEKSSLLNVDSSDMAPMVVDYADQMTGDSTTPKVMRKRKAEEEVVPFSASKKKAILQHMPQMSALASTPFTPHTRKGTKPTDFMDTPTIKFANNSHMVFNANSSTPGATTPKRKGEKLFSPYSATKVKRANSSGKSGCFSPQAKKNTTRMSVRGFLRRLSGGREKHPSPSDEGPTLARSPSARKSSRRRVPNSLDIMDPSAGHKKQKFFRNHRKNPSSPARLVSKMAAEMQRERELGRSIHERHAAGAASRYQQSSPLEDNVANMSHPVLLDGRDLDRTPVAGDTVLVGLKRGKPNTVKTGLPPTYQKRRSLDVEILRQAKEHQESAEHVETVANAVDTSPILPKRKCSHDSESEEEDDEDEMETDVDLVVPPPSDSSSIKDEESVIETKLTPSLMRQASKISLASDRMDLYSDDYPLDTDMDKAFIDESMIAGDGESHDTMLENLEEDHDGVSGGGISKMEPQETDEPELDIDEDSKQKESNVPCKAAPSDSCLQHQPSVGSIDSAMSEYRTFSKSTTVSSLQSCDSGLGQSPEDRDRLLAKPKAASDSKLMIPSGPPPSASEAKDGHTPEAYHQLNERSRQVVIRKRPEGKNVAAKRRSFEPNLSISVGTHKMLSKLGAMSQDALPVRRNVPSSDFVAVSAAEDVNVSAVSAKTASQDIATNSSLHAKSYTENPGSQSFTRQHPAAAPLQIPGAFIRSTETGAGSSKRYPPGSHSHLQHSVRGSVRRPHLPLDSPNILKRNYVDSASARGVSGGTQNKDRKDQDLATPKPDPAAPILPHDDTAGHTPLQPLPHSRLQAVGIQDNSCENSEKGPTHSELPHVPRRLPLVERNVLDGVEARSQLESGV